MHECTDAQTNLCLRCTHAGLCTPAGEADTGGTHQQAITQHMHPPAHTPLFHLDPGWSHSDSCLTSIGNLCTCFYLPRCSLEEGASVRSYSRISVDFIACDPAWPQQKPLPGGLFCHADCGVLMDISVFKCFRMAHMEALAAVSHSLSCAVLRETIHTETLIFNGVWCWVGLLLKQCHPWTKRHFF